MTRLPVADPVILLVDDPLAGPDAPTTYPHSCEPSAAVREPPPPEFDRRSCRWPRGAAAACKSRVHRFKSGTRLQLDGRTRLSCRCAADATMVRPTEPSAKAGMISGQRPTEYLLSGWAPGLPRRSERHAFAGSPEDAENFGGFVSGTAEPVRNFGVECGDFAWSEHQVLVSENEPHVPG
jgi:hypothetical protein